MTLRNAYSISSCDIQAGDVFVFAVKLMVVRTQNGKPIYRIYRCPFEGDEEPQGERIDGDREVAVMQALFPVVAWANGKADPT